MDTFTVHHSQEEGICRLSNSTQSFFSLKYVDTFTVHHTQQGGIYRDSHTLHSACFHSSTQIPSLCTTPSKEEYAETHILYTVSVVTPVFTYQTEWELAVISRKLGQIGPLISKIN